MKTCIFDLETFTLHADTGILLCASFKEYDRNKVTTIRADSYPNWRKSRSDVKPVCRAIIEALEGFDIFVAHNGLWFDRAMLVSWALKYNLPLFLRFAKFIDPVHLCRQKMRLSRNSLSSVLQFLGIEQEKTPIKWDHWKQAAYDGSRSSMDYIVEHCETDVWALEAAYCKMRKLVREINDRGSAW